MTERAKIHGQGVPARNEHIIMIRLQGKGLAQTNRLAQTATDAIAHHGVARLLGDREANPGAAGVIDLALARL